MELQGLVELQGSLEVLREQGLGVAAISFDSQEVLADFSRRRGITFPLLSDAGSQTIEAFGILNTVAVEALETLGPGRRDPTRVDPAFEADIGKYVTVSAPIGFHVGTPFPGTFIVDPEGRVTARFFEDFYRERNTVSSLLLRLGAGTEPVEATQVSTAHLQVTTYLSDTAISSGSRFSVVLDIEPRPGMHVYAPGADADGYRVVTPRMDPQPYVRLLPVEYPASEQYLFEPLDEVEPVYMDRFTLRQDIVLEATRQTEAALGLRRSLVPDDVPREELALGGTLTLRGTLDYQACDDSICYNPVSVPLSWTVTLTPLDSELTSESQLPRLLRQYPPRRR